MTDEQKITHILSCVSTHTPEDLLRMIMTLEDPTNVDKIVFHPSFPKDLYEKLDALSLEWIKPINEERARVQKERARVQKERARVQKERARVQKEIARVQKERARVQEEIKRADALIEDLQSQRRMVQDLNKVIEGQLGMYKELNSQLL